MKVLGFTIFVIALLAGVFLLGSLVLMTLVNVVLGHYDAKLLDFNSAMAIVALLFAFSGAFIVTSKS